MTSPGGEASASGHVFLLAGTVAGAVVLLSLIVVAVLFQRRRTRIRVHRKPSNGSAALAPRNDATGMFVNPAYSTQTPALAPGYLAPSAAAIRPTSDYGTTAIRPTSDYNIAYYASTTQHQQRTYAVPVGGGGGGRPSYRLPTNNVSGDAVYQAPAPLSKVENNYVMPSALSNMAKAASTSPYAALSPDHATYTSVRDTQNTDVVYAAVGSRHPQGDYVAAEFLSSHGNDADGDGGDCGGVVDDTNGDDPSYLDVQATMDHRTQGGSEV